MKKEVQSAQFIKGIRGTDDILFNGIPQIAFIGRSNVGKSSVINALTKRKNLVKESSQPGKTREINFFLINEKKYFVDLPGYGYAKVSEKIREQLRKMILWYCGGIEIKNRLIVLIVDAKIGPQAFDREILMFLEERNIPVLILANKFDKIRKSDWHKREKELQETVVGREMIPFSSHTGLGREEVLEKIL